jgi:hypothetical protein
VGCTTGSRGEVPGERKHVIRDDDDDDDDDDYNHYHNNYKHVSEYITLSEELKQMWHQHLVVLCIVPICLSSTGTVLKKFHSSIILQELPNDICIRRRKSAETDTCSICGNFRFRITHLSEDICILRSSNSTHFVYYYYAYKICTCLNT